MRPGKDTDLYFLLRFFLSKCHIVSLCVYESAFKSRRVQKYRCFDCILKAMIHFSFEDTIWHGNFSFSLANVVLLWELPYFSHAS